MWNQDGKRLILNCNHFSINKAVNMLKIAIASGKGGTGKTLIATNLAVSISDNVQLLDCDVEEPNCHIFFKPDFLVEEKVNVLLPQVNDQKCTLCKKCSEVCQYNAIAILVKSVLIFPELCHSCGGCARFCPEKAITEIPREVGLIKSGKVNQVDFVQGEMNVGEARPSPVIQAVKEHIDKNKTVIIDSPPGTSCPVVETMKGMDYCVLVTEPTPFGLNDLKLAVEVVRKLGISAGVIINRADIGNDDVRNFCTESNIDVLMELPYDIRIAVAYSRGELIVEKYPEWRDKFKKLIGKIENFL